LAVGRGSGGTGSCAVVVIGLVYAGIAGVAGRVVGLEGWIRFLGVHVLVVEKKRHFVE